MSGEKVPVNMHGRSKTDMLLRNLDCAVIERINDIRTSQEQEQFDSVRGVFVEGKPAFEGSSIAEKTHIQICIRNQNCIKGYFAPVEPIYSPLSMVLKYPHEPTILSGIFNRSNLRDRADGV